MITYTCGDIFSSNATAIVNTVNTEGIMGKGLALQFKKRFPDNFKAYEKACKDGHVSIGKMFIFTSNTLEGSRLIINFPTKKLWRNKSSLADISAGLSALVTDIKRLGITSIAIPPLGCGLGGLSWKDVKAEIEKAFASLPDVDVQVFEPLNTSNPAPVSALPTKPLTPAKATVLTTFEHYMELAVATNLTFVEAHKLCYLLQVNGVDLKLRFAPWRYGPYAKNLKFVLSDMEGIWIRGFRDGTAKAFDSFEVLPKAQEARSVTLNSNLNNVYKKIDKLIDGFESPLGLELLCTVHWLMIHDHIPPSLASITESITNWCHNQNGWGDRKRALFKPNHIEMAINRIQESLESSVQVQPIS